MGALPGHAATGKELCWVWLLQCKGSAIVMAFGKGNQELGWQGRVHVQAR